jgi:hypothetical protein
LSSTPIGEEESIRKPSIHIAKQKTLPLLALMGEGDPIFMLRGAPWGMKVCPENTFLRDEDSLDPF